MEIKGENFIKNVQMKQEREELQAQINEIDNNIEPPTASTFNYNNNQEENELEDIMLEETNKPNSSSNKTKYIALGLGLIVLFLLTIVAFRLLNNQSTQKSAFVENKEEIKQEEALNEDNIEQQYQKIINEKLKTIKEEKTTQKSLNLKEIEKEEQKVVVTPNKKEVEKTKELKKDIFDIKDGKKTVTPPKKTVSQIDTIKVAPKKEIEKILAPTTPKPTTSKKAVESKPTQTAVQTKATTSKPAGSFVQIGAFSKPISADYLANIKSQGLNYTLYKVNINGTMYTKVLIGPYRNRAHAQTSLPSIKQKLKINSAFILSF